MNDAAYFAHREQAERGLAELAAGPAVRDIHLQMAARYAELRQEALDRQTNAASSGDGPVGLEAAPAAGV